MLVQKKIYSSLTLLRSKEGNENIEKHREEHSLISNFCGNFKDFIDNSAYYCLARSGESRQLKQVLRQNNQNFNFTLYFLCTKKFNHLRHEFILRIFENLEENHRTEYI